ncbi:MAG: flagellar basal body P-ring protein FlgI [Phycisphaeraceae bacterium]|nr:flagellar basal body P-ring protein FlgI [Phycisphaeraceae bacterium]
MRGMGRWLVALAVSGAGAWCAGCGSTKPKQERAISVMPTVRDVPAPLRGTVGSEVTFIGIEPTLISGYGLVVGLNGSGGGILTDAVAATMERMMALRGITSSAQVDGTALDLGDRAMTARELIRDKRTAVVVVFATIPPGAPAGYQFDVFVQALNATSLEGGTLWTTDLQLGPSEPFGGVQKKVIAQARGELFVNPFKDPGSPEAFRGSDVARVLGGGVVTSPLEVGMTLDNPSHARVRAIVSAVNSRFPPGPGDRLDTAHGKDDALIALTIPAGYRRTPADFIRMVQHMPYDARIPSEVHAKRFGQALSEYTDLTEELMWALRSLGDSPGVRSELRSLYASTDRDVRMGALRAGAFLGDEAAAAPLQEIAASSEGETRLEAIRMLGQVDGGFRVDRSLTEMLNHPDRWVRVAAYESLAKRAERSQAMRLARQERELRSGLGQLLNAEQIREWARVNLPGDGPQPVTRRPIDGRFLLDTAPGRSGTVYVTLQREPRIAVIGDDVVLSRPLLVSAWDDRLLLACDSPDDPIRLMHRDYKTGRVTVQEIGDSVTDLIRFMGHTPTPENPEPGLALTYSEIVGALAAIAEAHGMNADVVTEQDRLLAELLEARRATQVTPRPEGPDDETGRFPLELPSLDGFGEQEPVRPKIVPLRPSEGLGEDRPES